VDYDLASVTKQMCIGLIMDESFNLWRFRPEWHIIYQVYSWQGVQSIRFISGCAGFAFSQFEETEDLGRNQGDMHCGE
jgi:hypothetical protein